LVPRTHAQAIELDRNNGNTKWQDSEKTEKAQLAESMSLIDNVVGGKSPDGYKKARW
jgi:hypothetical protein